MDRASGDSPLRCVFLCEFHPIAGPKITCQVPENYIGKEIFDAVSVYIIPKAQLQRSTLTVTLFKSKILGFPVSIDDSKKYIRNIYYFNVCFVCDACSRSVQYEPVVKKLADYLVTLELDSHFLSKVCQNQPERLRRMLRHVLEDLNEKRECTITEGTNTTHLRVVRLSSDPEPVQDYHVPILITDAEMFRSEQWDLTTNQVLPYIDGFNHVARIAAEADVENNLVKSCVQNLIYYGVVTVIPIFQYSNVYAATPKLRLLAEDGLLQDKCIKYVSKSVRYPATIRDIFFVYSNMTYGTTVRDLCVRMNPHRLRINERKLVQFGVLEGLIRRIHKYPVYICNEESSQTLDNLYKYFNGKASLDEICCYSGINAHDLEDQIDQDPNVFVVWK